MGRRHMLLYIFLIALATRVVFVATRGDALVWPDATDYHVIARNVMNGNGFLETDGQRASRAPGYPLFLAACYSVGLRSPKAVYALQALAGAVTCLLIALLGRKLYGDTVGLIAGCLSAFYPFFIYYTGLMLTETVFILGFVGYILCLAHMDHSLTAPKAKLGLLSAGTGLIAGLLILVRSSLLLFPFFLLPFWLIHGKPRRRVALAWAVMMLAICAALLPWTLRNHRLFGHFIPTTLQVGPSLYEANSRHADGGPAMHRIDWIAERGGGRMSEYENNEFFKKAALQYMRENPGRVLALAVTKARRFWNVIPNYAPYRRPLYAAISLCSYVPLILLAIAGLALRRSRSKALLFLLPPVAYFAALHMVFVGSTRYRTAIMPFVILISAAGLEALRAKVALSRRRKEQAKVGTRPRVESSPPRMRKRVFLAGGILLLLSAAGVGLWRHYMNPERLRVVAQERLTRIAGGEVLVARAWFSPLRGLILKDVRIQDRYWKAGLPAARIGTALLSPAWTRLLLGKLVWRRVELESVELNAQFDDEGRWPFLDQIHPLRAQPTAAPTVFISRARVRVAGLRERMGLPVVEFARLNATFRAADATGEIYNVVVWSEERARGRPRVTAQIEPKSQRVQGKISILGLSLDEQVRRSLPLSLQALWDDLAPEGNSSLEMNGRFSWNLQREPPLHVQGKVYLNVGSFHHKLFPYPITDFRAEANFDRLTFRVGWFHAFAGKAEISGAGEGVFTPDGAVSGEAIIRAGGVVLDEKLRDALPAGARRTWNRIRPGGSVDVLAHLKTTPDRDVPEVYAEIVLNGCSCAPREAPVSLTDIRGRLLLADRRLVMRGVHGNAGGAKFTTRDGFVSLAGNGPFSVRVDVERLKLKRVARDLMPAQAIALLPSPIRKFHAEGTVACELDLSIRAARDKLGAQAHLQADAGVRNLALSHPTEGTVTCKLDVSVRATREKPGKQARFEADVDLREMVFTHPRLAKPLTMLRTRAHVTEQFLKLEPTTAKWGKATIALPATRISLSASAANRVALTLRHLTLDKALYDLLPCSFQDMWDRLGAKGNMKNIALRLQRKAGPDRPFRVSGEAEFQDMEIVYAGFPYPVRGVTGRMDFDDGVVRSAEFQGKNGAAEIDFGFYREPSDAEYLARIVLEARRTPLDATLRAALPARHQALWDLLKPDGVMDLKLQHRFQPFPQGPTAFKYDAEVLFHRLALKGATPTTATNVRIAIREAERNASARTSVRGTVSVAGLSIGRTTVSNLRASFRSRGGHLAVEGVSADCYGGKLIGAVSGSRAADSEGAVQFSGVVNLADADAGRILEHQGKKPMAGRLNASGTFSGRFSDALEFSSLGAMTIRDGEIGELPGVLAVLNLFRFYGLDAPAFHSVELVYELKNQRLRAHEINLLGDILSLYGHGEVDREGKVNFRFRSEIGPRVNIPGLGTLLDIVKDKVIPITVRGDYDDPVWQINPVLSMTRTLQGLLQDLIPLRLWQATEENAGVNEK